MTRLSRVMEAVDQLHSDELFDVDVVDVTTDSREVRPGWIFVAVRGTSFDGHTAITNAVAAGAVAIVAEIAPNGPCGVPVVTVKDSRLAFAQIVRVVTNGPATGLHIYGVTGTNGKTTCATILEQMFALAGRRVGFIGTTGNRFAGEVLATNYTTPHARALADLFLEMRGHSIDTVCMEVSSHALDQHRVWGVPFRGAIFTNLTRDHLDYHRTMEAYGRAKKRLFDMLEPDAVAVLDADSEWTPYMKRHCKAERTITVGRDVDADVRIVDVDLSLRGASFALVRRRSDLQNIPPRLECTTSLLGDFNVTNAAVCAVMCLAEGIPDADVVQHLSQVSGPAGRMERHLLPNGAVAVVDYAHTPDALDNALRVLRKLHADSSARPHIHVVFGCGGDRDKGKRPEMGRIAALHADFIWLTSDNPRSEDPADILRHILGGIEGAVRERTTVIEDRRDAIRAALAAAGPNDVVLVAGKGHEEYQIIGLERLPFSDAAEIIAIGTAGRSGSM
ncbi:MAG: UDP-N-acetylmuramoyl-L-alanyl-D-glutamate--2,6-diaminopimelate ligase [Candidatus Kapabacteria bacterium]|nr:UDP-N-acetylmuramoyl-L-alanyl-D-glutamate--2,6-diaminopimelate ligase [Candidatus Kapabacteria bacterium]